MRTMQTTATGFRLNVMAALSEVLEMPVVAGRVDGAVKQRSVCSVFPIRRARDPENALEEDVVLGVRCWLRFKDQKDADRPIDTTSLEELSELVLVTLSKVQTQLGPWYVDVTGVSFDSEAQGIEVTVVGRQANPFTMCEEG